MNEEVQATSAGPEDDVQALRARLRDVRAARADLPPHSAQQWHAELDREITRLQRRMAQLQPDTN